MSKKHLHLVFQTVSVSLNHPAMCLLKDAHTIRL